MRLNYTIVRYIDSDEPAYLSFTRGWSPRLLDSDIIWGPKDDVWLYMLLLRVKQPDWTFRLMVRGERDSDDPSHFIVQVSGHLDLTEEEFNDHYIPLLQFWAVCGASFLVGDARGADTMVQRWLHKNVMVSALVTVYHTFPAPREWQGGHLYGYQSDKERDIAMTRASHVDLAWVRPGRENSGTALNLKRRKELGMVDYLNRVLISRWALLLET